MYGTKTSWKKCLEVWRMSGADIWRKIQGSNFRCKVANKFLDICRGIKIIPSPPSLSCESSVFVKLNLDSKKMQKI